MDNVQRILVVDDEEALCRMVDAILSDSGYEVTTLTRAADAVEAFEAGRFDLLVTDVKMPGMDGLEVLRRVKAADPSLPVIVVTAHATVEMSIAALRRGAYDMLTKPFEPEELIHRVRNALRQRELLEENRGLKEELAQKSRFASIVGDSPRLLAVLETARKVAARDIPVLITGESGTGKELVAQAIHAHSTRRAGKFVAINCGALPQTLLESELFGSRKGAFTGADRDRKGLLETADGGTLFLDEAGTLPADVQKTLLRFLQEQEFYRVGDARPTRVNVRVLSATNADLEAEVREGRFREDLFYRLNVVNLHLPPLRERAEDIPLLIAHLLRELNARLGTHVKGFTPEALEAACRHPWPGNVRQLRNVVEACLAVSGAEYVDLDVLAQFTGRDRAAAVPQEEAAVVASGSYAAALARFEVAYLRRLLHATGGNVEEAARLADMNMATIYRKIKKYGLRKEACA